MHFHRFNRHFANAWNCLYYGEDDIAKVACTMHKHMLRNRKLKAFKNTEKLK